VGEQEMSVSAQVQRAASAKVHRAAGRYWMQQARRPKGTGPRL
jgi:hypothetical protein